MTFLHDDGHWVNLYFLSIYVYFLVKLLEFTVFQNKHVIYLSSFNVFSGENSSISETFGFLEKEKRGRKSKCRIKCGKESNMTHIIWTAAPPAVIRDLHHPTPSSLSEFSQVCEKNLFGNACFSDLPEDITLNGKSNGSPKSGWALVFPNLSQSKI